MPSRSPYRVLFVCTGNSARSILAEFILNNRANGRFVAFSAGAEPAGRINPYVEQILKDEWKADVSRARSKPLSEYNGQAFDFIITLCDKAREACPAWAGHPITAHWASPDPARVTGTDEEKRRAVRDVATVIATRIGLFTSLRDEDLDALRIGQIGTQPTATRP